MFGSTWRNNSEPFKQKGRSKECGARWRRCKIKNDPKNDSKAMIVQSKNIEKIGILHSHNQLLETITATNGNCRNLEKKKQWRERKERTLYFLPPLVVLTFGSQMNLIRKVLPARKLLPTAISSQDPLRKLTGTDGTSDWNSWKPIGSRFVWRFRNRNIACITCCDKSSRASFRKLTSTYRSFSELSCIRPQEI